MATTMEYEQKIKDMQKYIPFLESLIKKMKNNKDEKRESHLHKVEMLYGLLTNKDKKLKLETLQKCESVLVKLCEKIEKTDVNVPSTSSALSQSSGSKPIAFPSKPTNHAPADDLEDISAPASPSNSDPVVEHHNPIVIPTERRETPPPPTRRNYDEHSRNGGYNDRDRRVDNKRHSESSKDSSHHSPELFRRRSPNRDRPTRFDEELWRKYESPPPVSSFSKDKYNDQSSSTYSRNRDFSTSRPRNKTVRTSFSSEVLKSPPLTMDDLKDLLVNEPSEQATTHQHLIMPSIPLPIPPPLPTSTPPRPVPPPLPQTRSDPRFDHNIEPRFDQRPNDVRNFPTTPTGVSNQMSGMRVDPRIAPRSDPRVSRGDPSGHGHQPVEPARQQDHINPKPVEPPMRLAFKYNPHPRREAPAKPIEYDQSPRIDDNRGINMPGVNLSDPRLRNRSMFIPENICPPHINSPMGNLPSPIGNMASPMSPMANFGANKMLDNHNSPNYGNNPHMFPQFPQMMQSPNMFVNSPINRFKLQTPPQPRTYGEYRKFKQTLHQKHGHNQNQQQFVDPKKDPSCYGQNHSPLEVTVKPMQFSNETAPSVLDAMYRNTDFKKDSTGGVQSFKIPKIRKDPPAGDEASKNNEKSKNDDDWNNEDSFDRVSSGTGQAKQQPKSQSEDNWDDDVAIETTKSAHNEKTSSKTKVDADEDNWDDDDEPSQANQKSSKEKDSKKDDNDDNDDWNDNTDDWGQSGGDAYDSVSSDDYFEARQKSATKPKKATEKDSANPSNKKKASKSTNSATKTQVDKRAPEITNKQNTSTNEKVNTMKINSSKKCKEEDSTKERESDKCEEKIGEEGADEEPLKGKNQRKRKSGAGVAKPAAKVAKLDEVVLNDDDTTIESDLPTKEESSTKPSEVLVEENVTQANEEDEDEETPDTIINSDISFKNIIDGPRRTRGSNRFHPAYVNAAPATSPTKVVSPPKKKQKTTPSKPAEESSEECAVSSTTTITEPVVDESKSKKVASSRKKKATPTSKKGKQPQAKPAEEEKDTEPVETDTHDVNAAASTSTAAPAAPTTETATKEKDEITKEWLESFLLNLFNPAQMSTTSVLGMLSKVLDPTKFEQVKQILCSESPSVTEPPSGKETDASTPTEEPSMELISDTKDKAIKPKPKKKKNELDRLNDDIREMFICQGVLTATGRRMCSAISEKEGLYEECEDEEDASFETSTPKTVTAKSTTATASKSTTTADPKSTTSADPKAITVAIDKAMPKKPAPPKKRGRRAGVFWKGNKRKGRGRPRKGPAKEKLEFEIVDGGDVHEPSEIDDDELPLSGQVKIRNEKKPEEEGVEVFKIVVGGEDESAVKSDEENSVEVLDSSSEDPDYNQTNKIKNDQTKIDLKATDKIEDAPILKAECKINAEIDLNLADLREIPNLLPVVRLRRGRGRPPKPDPLTLVGEPHQKVEELKNTNPNMHSMSEYASKCVLCSFAGRYMPNHYIHIHPESEVFISRLPPQSQAQLLQGVGSVPKFIKKYTGKLVFENECQFCEIKNAFTRVGWFDHYGTHTGEYTFKCSACHRMFNMKSEITRHIKIKCIKGKAVRLRGHLGLGKIIEAFFCSICNYIQLKRENIVLHLHNQHDINDDSEISTIILLKCIMRDHELDKAVGENGSDVNKQTLEVATMDNRMESLGAGEVTDAEKNREVFVSNEQNDINLDTNIIQFMRDVSFSATGSPPRQTTMSVADRINQRLKIASSQALSDQSDSELSQITPQKSMSMAERLSERFSRTPPSFSDPEISATSASPKTINYLDLLNKSAFAKEESGPTKQNTALEIVNNTQTSIELAERESEPITDTSLLPTIVESTRSSVHEANQFKQPTKLEITEDTVKNDSNDDVIIISDGEDDAKAAKNKKSTVESTDTKQEDNEVLDDDDDWEDIETPPSPSCLENDTKGPPNDNKLKKNKTIYATLSRLYASIVQPKSKNKPPNTSSKETAKSTESEAKDDNVDRKKSEANGMQRINRLGYSRRTPNTLKYHCLVEKCSFLYSDIPEGLKNHVIFEHQNLAWDGFCYSCDAKVNLGEKLALLDEVHHMQDVHVNSTVKRPASATHIRNPSPSTSGSPAPLKIRRLSGDILSGQIQVSLKPPSPPPLQIASAVSLNIDSDIWKPIQGNIHKNDTSAIKPIATSVTSPVGASTALTKSSPPLKITQIRSMSDTSSRISTTNQTESPSQLKINQIRSVTEPNAKIENINLAINQTEPLNKLKIVRVESQTPLPLKPWTTCTSVKSEAIVKTLLKLENLIALYKCMANECSFASDTKDVFRSHVKLHFASGVKSLECCYCKTIAGTACMLANHIEHIHSKDIYQCPYCFYRALEKYSVVTHKNIFHATSPLKILVHATAGTDIDKQPLFPDFLKIRETFTANVDAIKCAECPKAFTSARQFINHFAMHSDWLKCRSYPCSLCSPPQTISLENNGVISHLTNIHGISDSYQCVYCKYASSEVHEMEIHLANNHASNYMFCCARTDFNTSTKKAFFSGGMRFFHLSKPVTSGLAHISYIDEKLSNSNLVERSKIILAPRDSSRFNVPVKTYSKDQPLDIVKDIEPKTTQTTNAFKVSSGTVVTDTQKSNMVTNIQPDDVQNQLFGGAAPTEAPESAMSNVSLDRPAKIFKAATEIVKNTGFDAQDLYRCGFPECRQLNLNNQGNMKKHLLQIHSNSTTFPCGHCDKEFKTRFECAQHFPIHEQHRYFCFLCFASDRSATALALHMSKDHSIKGKSTYVTYALMKGKIDAKKDFFFVCPNSVKVTDVWRFGDRLLTMWERKKWSRMKKSFTPDEIDQLPRHAIFLDQLCCAVCQYKTKVRTNLYRHLLFHKNEVNVASVDPVNPVPCLNTNEKHFDKMTNLACSSHANKPPPAATGPLNADDSTYIPLGKEGNVLRRIEHVLPEFIPVNIRFVCKYGDCKYSTANESVFKHHLNAVHANEKNYVCPHCNVTVCSNKICPDKVIHHMKFHDTNLYQCKRCGYLHFHKPVMERHLSDKHSDEDVTYFIYDRTESGVTKSSSGSRYFRSKPGCESVAKFSESSKPETSGPTMKWQCTLCKTKTVTQQQMNAHINTAHSMKYRYQCSKCNFGGVMISAISDHAQRKHPDAMAEVICFYSKVDEMNVEQAKTDDTTPLWRRDPNKVKNIRGILMEEESDSPASTIDDNDLTLDDADDLIEVDEVDEVSENDENNTESTVGLKIQSVAGDQFFCEVCAHVCQDNSSLLSHMREAHASEEKDNLNMLFIYVCYYCKTTCKSYSDFRGHWEKEHKVISTAEGNGGRAAWFTVWRRLKCARCSLTNDYRELAIHHFLEHSKDTFAVRDIENDLKCGHCQFVAKSNVSELVKHYECEHPIVPSDTNQSPVPPSPCTPVTSNQVRDFRSFGDTLQFCKCNICHAVMHDVQSCTMHCAKAHKIEKNIPCTVLQGTIFKCPTCQFCSPLELNVIKHISNKLKSGKFYFTESIMQAKRVKPSVWPYLTMQVVFPNGLVLDKYRLLGTPYGNFAIIEEFLKKQNGGVVIRINQKLQSTVFALDESSDGTKNVSENSEPAKTSLKSKRSIEPAATSKNNTTLENESTSFDSTNPTKKRKPSEAENSVQNEQTPLQIATSSTTSPLDTVSETQDGKDQKTPNPNEIASSSREKKLNLDKITANVIVDGVKVIIPARDFHKVFKKQLTLTLQKVDMDIDEMTGPNQEKSDANCTQQIGVNNSTPAAAGNDHQNSK